MTEDNYRMQAIKHNVALHLLALAVVRSGHTLDICKVLRKTLIENDNPEQVECLELAMDVLDSARRYKADP